MISLPLTHRVWVGKVCAVGSGLSPEVLIDLAVDVFCDPSAICDCSEESNLDPPAILGDVAFLLMRSCVATH